MKDFIELHVLTILRGRSNHKEEDLTSIPSLHTTGPAEPNIFKEPCASLITATSSTELPSTSVEDLTTSQFTPAVLREHMSSPGDDGLADYFIVSSGDDPVTGEEGEKSGKSSTIHTAEEDEGKEENIKVSIPTMASNFSVF